ncbi:MAG: hypothetical protein JWO25_3629, partial [Alphaproteobacteria bacterium]|nr:hypothetical protein [Alphaproteobacteria bacterium]
MGQILDGILKPGANCAAAALLFGVFFSSDRRGAK